MNNFIKRTLSAAVFGTIVLSTFLVDTPYYFALVFMLLTAISVFEYYRLGQSSIKSTSVAVAASILLYTTLFFFFQGNKIFNWFLFAYSTVFTFAIIRELFIQEGNPITNWGYLCRSQIMIVVPLALTNGIFAADKFFMLAFILIIWIHDTGAYIVGTLTSKRKKGNHKMFPRVSPAKSWEGLIGALIFDLAAGLLFYHIGWTDHFTLTSEPWIDSMLFALTIGIFGTFGDLLESLFKRTLGVKDSGNILPGHGGMLDRLDSLLLAVPVVYFIFMYLADFFVITLPVLDVPIKIIELRNILPLP
jgi:phosphatidate cytidylyltransferase